MVNKERALEKARAYKRDSSKSSLDEQKSQHRLRLREEQLAPKQVGKAETRYSGPNKAWGLTLMQAFAFASIDTLDKMEKAVDGLKAEKACMVHFEGLNPWAENRLSIWGTILPSFLKRYIHGRYLRGYAELDIIDGLKDYEKAKQTAIRAHQEGRPVIVSAYSNMGMLWNKGLFGPGFLGELAQAGVDVELLVLFDDSGHHPIPENVQEVVNIYTKQPPVKGRDSLSRAFRWVNLLTFPKVP
jgi:hypothetical protein